MSNQPNSAHLSRINEAREGNGRFGRWLSSESPDVTLAAPQPQALSLQEMKELHTESARRARKAEHEEKMSGIAVAAQLVLEDHPGAASIVLTVDDYDLMDKVRVYNASGDQIGLYDVEAGGGPDWTASHEWLSNLDAPSRSAAWAVYTPEVKETLDDHRRLMLTPAAAWSPEPAGDDLAA